MEEMTKMSRLNELLQQAGNIGRNEDGSITRLGFSEKYFQALEFLKGRMQELGMQVETEPGRKSSWRIAGE